MKNVAAIVTEYRRNSHADVIVGKILEGFNHSNRERPNMRVVSMYVDQFPNNDMARALSRRYNFPIYDSIEAAVCRGGNRLAVDGVLSIGEHGNYPFNDLGQHLYPRRRFFTGIANVFQRSGRSVPVFSDKHLAPTWEDAIWMYNRARQLHVPLMAGSSLPVTWRRPALELEFNTPLEEAVQVGYGGVESYGFHAIEAMQCLVESRRGGESGVRSVQCLQGEAMWTAMDNGAWSRTLLEAALDLVPAHANGDYRQVALRNRNSAVYLIEYRDGFKAAVAMMNGYVYERDGGAFCFAGRVTGREQPVRTQFYLQNERPFAHFAYLTRAIDFMMGSFHSPYPAERTLLTTGILDAVMRSKHNNHRRLQTPHLDIRYQPTGWPFATGDVPPRLQD